MTWFVVAIGIIGITALAAFVSFVRAHGPARVAWRFATGHHLDGKRRTDAGFLRRGVRTFDPTGRASRWAHLPHAHRAGIRWAVSVLACSLIWGAHTHPLATVVALALLGAAGAVMGVVRAWRAVVMLRHRHQLESPLALALSPVLAVTPQVAGAALAVTHGYADTKGGEPVARLELPSHFHADSDQQRRIESLFESRLGVDCRFKWRMSKSPMFCEVTRAPVPPDMVPLPEVLEDIDRCKEGQVILGKDSNGRIFHGDFLNEDPHWGVSAGSRRGKSTLLCMTAAQLLRQGAERVTGVDPKMTSLDAIVGLPRVDIHNDPRNVQDMWNAIHDFRLFMEARMDAYAADRTLEFERALLIVDEVNQFSGMSTDHWREIKEKGDPAQPPVWRDLAAIGWMGAQFKCNMIVVGQRLDTTATGGQGLRDSFGIRMLAGFTPQQWNFLVGSHPIPRSQKPRGRFIVVNGGEQTWVQLTYGSEQEIRDLASKRQDDECTSPDTASTGSSTPRGTEDTPTALPVRYGLREASNDLGIGVVPMSLEALKKARQRDSEFPEGRMTPTGETYTEAELCAWHEARESRKASA